MRQQSHSQKGRGIPMAVLLLLLHCLAACGHWGMTAGPLPLVESIRAPATLQVHSLDFQDNGPLDKNQVFHGFGCEGFNKSPQLSWKGAPARSKSYAIIMHDPDAPTGVGFFHWLLFNIPASIGALSSAAADHLPSDVISGHTDFGIASYGGPCPPKGGPHRYVITVYALDVPKLDLDSNATGALLRFVLSQHTLAYGRIWGTYKRS